MKDTLIHKNNLGWVFRQRVFCLTLIGFLAFGGSWLVSLAQGVPVPIIHDEYSFLLAGDTFAHGRLTNPPHPFWRHFETFYELMRPSYMSEFPPAQGIFLAIGKVLFGHPIWGVWMSDGLMCVAICWMLYAFVPARWAVIGGLVAVMQWGVFTYWSQSYWGGAVTAMGGALVFGAYPRIMTNGRARDVLWFSLGVLFLFFSRPLEGVLLGIPLGLMILPGRKTSHRWQNSGSVIKLILTFCLCLAFIIALTGFYNKQVTGRAAVFPYIEYTKTYSSIPLFIWQPMHPDVSINPWLKKSDLDHRAYFFQKKSLSGLAQFTEAGIIHLWRFYFGWPLGFFVLFLVVFLNFSLIRWVRLFLAGAIFLAVIACAYCPVQIHYYASFTCLMCLFTIEGMMLCSSVRCVRIPVGKWIVLLLVLVQIVQWLSHLNDVHTTQHHPSLARSLARQIKTEAPLLRGDFTRQQLIQILGSKKGKHLVIVHYPTDHFYYFEWVFNEADIDHSDIVWARDLGDGPDRQLTAYFKDRDVIHVEVYEKDPFPNVQKVNTFDIPDNVF